MMNNDSPLISVIIPVYNGDRYLAEAIESILAQNYHPIEIVIIDDGSTDNTRQVVEGFNQDYIYYIYQSNRGVAATRNAGLEIAAGDLITFLDADDFWSKTKLKFQINLLNKNPSLEIILGYQQTIYPIKSTDEKPGFDYCKPTMAFLLGTGLFRKSAFDRVGLFDEELRYAEDWDWFMRARELKTLMKIHPETVLFYRRHDRNITNQLEVSNRHLAKMFKKSLDRRREQNSGLATSLPNLSDFQVKNTND